VKTNIVLIDFENVQPKDLANLRGTSFQIRIFCGANQSKIPFDLADQLQPLGPNAKYIRIQGTGKNALDFHIAYYIGLLSARHLRSSAFSFQGFGSPLFPRRPLAHIPQRGQFHTTHTLEGLPHSRGRGQL
jgi:hypothetical protein